MKWNSKEALIAASILFWPLGVFLAARYRPHLLKRPEYMIPLALWAFFGLVVAILPSTNPSREVQETPIMETKTISETEVIPFSEQRSEDGTINQGEERVGQEGVNGQRKVYYEVSYEDGAEISRQMISEEVVLSPTPKIVLVGTYVAPVVRQFVSTPSATDQPSSTPTTQQPVAESNNLPFKALCNDGTYSYQDTPDHPNYQGMCSGHGGIKEKLGRVP